MDNFSPSRRSSCCGPRALPEGEAKRRTVGGERWEKQVSLSLDQFALMPLSEMLRLVQHLGPLFCYQGDWGMNEQLLIGYQG